MAAIANTGELYFTQYTSSFNGSLFLAFLKRLTATVDRKIHLIVDGHPVYRRVSVRDWLAEHVDSIEMHFLPAYSPELNPVELLNGDVKQHVAQMNPANRDEITVQARTHLRRRENQPRGGTSRSARQKSATRRSNSSALSSRHRCRVGVCPHCPGSNCRRLRQPSMPK